MSIIGPKNRISEKALKYNRASNSPAIRELIGGSFLSKKSSKQQEVLKVIQSADGKIDRARGYFKSGKGKYVSRKEADKMITNLKSQGYRGRGYTYKDIANLSGTNNSSKNINQNSRPAESRVYGQRQNSQVGGYSNSAGQLSAQNQSMEAPRMVKTNVASKKVYEMRKISASYSRGNKTL